MQKIAFLGSLLLLAPAAAHAEGLNALPGHVPEKAIAHATHLGRSASTELIQMAISLSLRNSDQLNDFLQKLYSPSDPNYRKYLTPEQFQAAYSPTNDDVNQVATYLAAKGLTITKIHPNHLVIDVEGSASTVENSFQLELHDYLTGDGRIVHAPTTNPLVTDSISTKINSIVGLSSFAKWKTHLKKNSVAVAPKADNAHASISTYLTPPNIKTAYDLTSVSETGSGEVVALMELDGYTPSDITAYASYFSLPAPILKNVMVDDATGVPGDGAGEVTLDIELVTALAPGASKIMVYEGINSSQGIIDAYNQIATDNLANEVSTSWGEAENELESGTQTAESAIFSQMAAQGQSVFAAAGDNGAYDDSENDVNTLQVDDPGSQPFVTAVGGTTLTLNSSHQRSTETSWVATASSGSGSSYVASEGGGGGLSTYWTTSNASISWQSGLSTVANKGSSTYRMVPDVSLEADPNTGYAIYFSGSWTVIGGTSCAAPLWAAFTAVVNQSRVTNNLARLGYMNPLLYTIGKGSSYSSAFYDITSGNNLYYPAETGYDLSTGWGTFNGVGLFNQLASVSTAPSAPSGFTISPVSLGINISWKATPGATSYSISRALSSGGDYTVLDGALGTNQYSDTGLTYGTTYYYEVTATNTAGTSPVSAVVSGTPYPVPPTAPSNLTATQIQ